MTQPHRGSKSGVSELLFPSPHLDPNGLQRHPGATRDSSITLVEKALLNVGPKFLENIGRQCSAKALGAPQESVVRIGLTLNTPDGTTSPSNRRWRRGGARHQSKSVSVSRTDRSYEEGRKRTHAYVTPSSMELAHPGAAHLPHTNRVGSAPSTRKGKVGEPRELICESVPICSLDLRKLGIHVATERQSLTEGNLLTRNLLFRVFCPL
jgi:hypothetical protein